MKPQKAWNKFQRFQRQRDTALLGFLFCSKPGLHNTDCQHPLPESAYTSYAKKTRHTAAQILKLLSQAGKLGKRGKLKLSGHYSHNGLWLLAQKLGLAPGW